METDMSQESISWAELAELTHDTQVERFGWCICEDPEQGQLNEGCPKRCDNCQENLATYTGVMTIKGEIALCESCHND